MIGMAQHRLHILQKPSSECREFGPLPSAQKQWSAEQILEAADLLCQ
jgi:hypothetical protein